MSYPEYNIKLLTYPRGFIMPEWTEKDFEIYDAIDWKLFKEIKALTDENLNNLAVLRRAYQLSLIALDLSIRHSDDNGADALVMDLHEYVGERLFIAEGKTTTIVGQRNSLNRLISSLLMEKRSLLSRLNLL